ncbi:MAG: serine/threonine-protein kinase, partial [Thermodesulfobacteriota bacterium]
MSSTNDNPHEKAADGSSSFNPAQPAKVPAAMPLASLNPEQIERLKAVDSRGTITTDGTIPASQVTDSRETISSVPPSQEPKILTADKDVPLLEIGQLWGWKYKILQEIGRGGMGIVYMAQDVILHRMVAIKVLLGGPRGAKEDKARFQREARMAARLSHQNIVAVYDTGISEQGLYFTMEYVPGQTLQQVIREQGQVLRRDFTRVIEILEKILEGTAYAHQNDVLHRDLKPSNILMSDTEIKIMDFGLAREIRPEERLTETGAFIGTPVYDSPEQIQAHHGELDERSDLYSIGVIFYEMLTGVVPFQH